MRTLPSALGVLFMAGTLIGTSGCSESAALEPQTATAAEVPWHYVEGRGVHLNEAGKQIAALELAEVVYGEVGAEVVASGRVFSVSEAERTARASVVVPVADAEAIVAGSDVVAHLGEDRPVLAGRVERVDPRFVDTSGQVELVVILDDPKGELESESFVSCRIVGAGGEGITLPASSVLKTARGDSVYVMNGDYLFRSPVQVGRENGEKVEIIDGLFEGDVVASAGLETLWLTELQSVNGGAACADGH